MVNQKAMISLELEKNDRRYILSIPMGAPLGESYDVVHEFLRELLSMSKVAAENAARSSGENVDVEIVKEKDA